MLVPLTDEDQPPEMPFVTIGLIALNIVLYFVLSGRDDYGELVKTYGYVAAHETMWSPLTALFLHASVLHVVGNMLYLWVVGSSLEFELGHLSFLLFFLACGSFGNFAHGKLIAHAMRTTPCIGASGAIAGLMGAYLLLFPRNRIRLFYWLFIVRGTFVVAAFIPIALWFVVQFMEGSHVGQTTQVAYGAHVGGFLVGALAATILVMMELVTPRWQTASRRRLGV